MVHSITPNFGAILVRQDQLPKLKNNRLGNPNFTMPYSRDRHFENNGLIKGALRNRTGYSDMYVGSFWGNEAGKHPMREAYKDSVVFVTHADAPPGHISSGKPFPAYKEKYPEEEILSNALDELHVQYKRGPLQEIYKEVYQSEK